MKVGYKVKIGGWSVDSSDDARTEVVRLDVMRALGSPADRCRIALYAPPKPKPSLLEQAAGAALDAVGLGGGAAGGPSAFSIEVRGQKVTYGDPIEIELTSGDVTAKVMKAEVQGIWSSFEETLIDGQTGIQKLATTRINKTFQNRSFGQMVRDLASAASVDAGTIDNGSDYAYLVAHESGSVFQHLIDLARREGVDVWFDEDNKLTAQKFNRSKADHELHYGIDLLDLQIFSHHSVADQIRVSGESPSSNQGSDTWHWITKDISPFRGEAGKGSRALARSDGSLRTKDAAAQAAKARMGDITDRARLGRARIIGNPAMHLGEAIEIKNAPQPECNGLFKIVALGHVYDKREGYTTTITFSGSGGSKQDGSMLGQLGALAGAVGL